MYSHNMYLNASLTDVTVRDTISMQASSFGLALRSGGFLEDNVFLDNNGGISTEGGNYNGAGPVGNYSLLADNVVTSGAHKTAYQIGTFTTGIIDRGELTSLLDNIVAHLADPNNPDELAQKTNTNPSLKVNNTYYDDTIVYNWEGSKPVTNSSKITEQNVDGLDTNALDLTTIQLFTAELLGKPDATIQDLADYLRAQSQEDVSDVVDADLIIQFFQEAFGIEADLRTSAEVLTFVPDDLGDGVRWDNRINWSTDDLPGTVSGDSVDLAGNHVVYSGTTKLANMDMGDGGLLIMNSGHLSVTGDLTAGSDGGTIQIDEAAQLWTEGYSDADLLTVELAGGRFSNTGDVDGNLDMLVSDNGQAILATAGGSYEVGDGHVLSIEGSDAQVGFDGTETGTASLFLGDDATLQFIADADGFGTIEEFRTGAYGDSSKVVSYADLGNASLEIDLASLSAGAGTEFTLMMLDEIVGTFETVEVTGLGGRDATITVDHESDEIRLTLTDGGSGAVSVEEIAGENLMTSLTSSTTVTEPPVDEIEELPIAI